MKKENTKSPNQAIQRDEDRWINVYDDALMIEMGIRPLHVFPRDKTVWTKTPNEKRLLKILRKSCKERIYFHTIPTKSIPVRAKLIIQLKKNDKYPKTTYSIECWQHEIGSILSNFYHENKVSKRIENLVSKYSYNGKTYSVTERPFWR